VNSNAADIIMPIWEDVTMDIYAKAKYNKPEGFAGMRIK
jgi:hypothetical protein